MKDVLAFLSPTVEDPLSAGAHYALALAHAHGAHLSALLAEIEANLSNLPLAPNLMQADEPTIKPPSSMEPLTRTADVFLSAAKLANVPCEILERGGAVSLRERMIDCAQARDVLIADVYGPLQYPHKSSD